MSKKRKITIYIISILCVLMIGFGTFFGINAYKYSKINFPVDDTLADGGGKKARVVILAGQSNASGCSVDKYLKKNVSEEKYAEYQNGYDNIYINYFASGTNQSNGFVKASTCQGEAGGYFGPELGMAEKLNELYPDELFFIIKYAWGGTALYDKWLSPSSSGKTGKLYQQFVRYVEISMEYLESKNYDVAIEGICFMQGESDAFSVENGTDYEEYLANFIKDARKKFSRYESLDGIAFIDATIAANPMYWVYYELVNESKVAVSKLSDMNVLIDTNEHGLTTSNEPEGTPDMAHYDSLSEIKLGHLFIEELVKFF